MNSLCNYAGIEYAKYTNILRQLYEPKRKIYDFIQPAHFRRILFVCVRCILGGGLAPPHPRRHRPPPRIRHKHKKNKAKIRIIYKIVNIRKSVRRRAICKPAARQAGVSRAMYPCIWVGLGIDPQRPVCTHTCTFFRIRKHRS